MKRVRRKLSYLLMVLLTVSSWAGAAPSCPENAPHMRAAMQAEMNGGAMVSSTHVAPTVMADHASHQPAGNDHEGAADDNESRNGCPDCFDCMVLCSMAGASVLADPTLLVAALIEGSADLIPSATDFRSNPPPQSLYRPPISLI